MNDPVTAEDFKEHEDYSSYSLKELEQYLKLCETTYDHYFSILKKSKEDSGIFYTYKAHLEIMLVDIEDVKKEIEKRKTR
jgi:hypothetical protein